MPATTEGSALRAGPLPLVGIAAGAGGLDALGLMARSLPAGTATAYVLAHQPTAGLRTALPPLLSERTALAVAELTEDVVPAPGTIHVPPPGCDAVLENGRLGARPATAAPGGRAPSADRLFESLARELGASATGVVLSGNGGDAAYGVQAIREAGGVTIAQRPVTARHDAMPLAAIRTGCVDLELAPEEIGRHLARLAARRPAAPDGADARRGTLNELMDLLAARTGIDFRDYRDNTVRRRLARRMTALAIADLDRYVAHCRTDPDELEALHRDLLISVTRFFRDGEAFETLGAALSRRLAGRDGPVRAWVAGCATGEEAFGVAILLAEALGGLDALGTRQVQIFATDVDDHALDVARRGAYPLAALGDVPSRFERDYFVERRGMVEVVPALRRTVLFSHHNVYQDPPFLHLDLVSLRNVLIYLKAPLQDRVLARMHYALDPGGLLLLGASETLSGLPERFRPLADGGLFGRMAADAAPEAMALGATVRTPAPPAASGPVGDTAAARALDRSMFDQLARTVAPNGFVMTRGQEIVRVLGDISAVTGLSEAAPPSLDASILPAPLRDDVARLVPVALRARGMREGQWHPIAGPGYDEVRLDAYPVPDAGGAMTQVLFSVRTRTRPDAPRASGAFGSPEGAAYVQDLELELDTTRSALGQSVAELRAFNEELRSANEELQSSNEELQAVNEELETANEELQSTNEELITVNEGMQDRGSALRSATADLDAIMEALPVAVVVVDAALTVRRASRTARELFSIAGRDAAGTPLSSLTVPKGLPLLTAFVREAVEAGAARTLRVRMGGTVRDLSAMPHDTGGADAVTTLVLTETALPEPDADAAAASHWSFDVPSGRCVWSAAALRLAGRRDDAPVPDVEAVWDGYLPEDSDRLRDAFRTCREEGHSYSLPVRLRRPDGTLVAIRSDGVAIRDAEGRIATIVGTLRPASEGA